MLENLNPRKHVSASIGWSVFIVIALAAPLCAWLVAKETEKFIRQSATQSLQQNATQIHREIASTLDSRLSVIRLIASHLDDLAHDLQEVKLTLDGIQDQYPEINWIGLTDMDGAVVASGDNVLLGQNASDKEWFIQGSKRAWLGDVRNADALQNLLPRRAGVSFKVVDVAVPVLDENGTTKAVLGAHLSWNWILNLQALSLSDVNSITPELQLILASEENIVLSGPAEFVGQPLPEFSELHQEGKYLVGFQRTGFSSSARLNWTVAIRGESDRAIAAGRSAQWSVILPVLGAALLAALLIFYAVSRLTRKLRTLSHDAAMVSVGKANQLTPMQGSDEVSQIGQVLATSFSNLQREKETLETLNTELDQRVAERTKSIERLSEESRDIALTQQRLRFARDMHDTLAHSMMAVLTQIRLVRKIRHRFSDEQVEEELGRAEDVALNGLTEARAAIQQIRTNNIHDKGISGALHELVERFRSRSGIRFTLQIDPKTIHQEDNRGETVYRIAEEALRNIEKHASASAVTITLDRIERSASAEPSIPTFRLEIIDDGVGFDVDKVGSGHYGLIGLREQAALINGELMIDSKPGGGTRLCLSYSAYLA